MKLLEVKIRPSSVGRMHTEGARKMNKEVLAWLLIAVLIVIVALAKVLKCVPLKPHLQQLTVPEQMQQPPVTPKHRAPAECSAGARRT